MWATSFILKEQSKVNNHPLGENSPNLVPLYIGETKWGLSDFFKKRKYTSCSQLPLEFVDWKTCVSTT
jgi:hypothetical protein